MDNTTLNFKGRGRGRPAQPKSSDDGDKKMVHREMERKRRKDMAKLHGSLRSLLPLEFIKGKRSMSDHMNEAVNYINQLQNNIKELGAKRDGLLKKGNSISHENESISGTSSGAVGPTTCVMVQPCSGGVEIMVNSGLTDEGLALSSVLQVLLDEGLVVYSCVCTRVNQRLIYTVQSEVSDMASVDLPGLKQKLTEAIPLSRK